MRTPLIAGNWKMHNAREQTRQLIGELKPLIDGLSDVEVCVCPPFTVLAVASETIGDAEISLGAQNVFWEEKGAWTSQISADMLLDVGCRYAILGHSETRGRFGKVDDLLAGRLHYFGERDDTINIKARVCLAKGLTPIICCGETIDERQAGKTDDIISSQIRACLDGLTPDQIETLVIAYEPVWAIGTGEVCGSDEANRVCRLIRQTVRDNFGTDAGNGVRILYGGSMNDKNAEELLEQSEIDGGLIGGAALKADSFATICKAASFAAWNFYI
ncbi:MAG: triose-phosphate isomerase [Armatimonadetes bacterium]|nr:triose-phosphate isomerase [Armatimonadota bacterium]